MMENYPFTIRLNWRTDYRNYQDLIFSVDMGIFIPMYMRDDHEDECKYMLRTDNTYIWLKHEVSRSEIHSDCEIYLVKFKFDKSGKCEWKTEIIKKGNPLLARFNEQLKDEICHELYKKLELSGESKLSIS